MSTRAIIVGTAQQEGGAPVYLAAALRRAGMECEVTRDLLKSVSACRAVAGRDSAVAFTADEAFPPWRRRQFAALAAMGVPLLRWWIGSDVQIALENPRMARKWRRMSSFVAREIAVAAHLVDELSSVGIRADYVPSVLLSSWEDTVVQDAGGASGVLVYLPEERREDYGSVVVEQLAEWNPDIRFVLVGDGAGNLDRFSNVETAGWCSDMESVWAKVSVLLRVTVHDGMPRMVLEALLRGKHVIYSMPFPGCMHARSAEEAQECLLQVCGTRLPNQNGVAAVKEIMQKNPDGQWADVVRHARTTPLKICRGAAWFLASSIGLMLSKSESEVEGAKGWGV